MPPQLASPARIAIAGVPVIAFLLTPFLPFVNTDSFWFGVPSVIAWSVVCVLVTVLAMNVVEWSYQRAGGSAVDAEESAAHSDPVIASAGRDGDRR
ncbi:hypothetical protein GCM10027169_36250 [Gordonia jinhuaensis]|uniref:DUF3311 domain-containing protein n=1 Tax=Gordonia jinhuaensis TaxID=1517702 RepID=A0A916WTK6_9ACTN|nr:hypothetical protein [Gordonia jinhuaensis]GGB29390.1 hypothetical protein GCM10011489_16890 [Gordonia jinhuaensis]